MAGTWPKTSSRPLQCLQHPCLGRATRGRATCARESSKFDKNGDRPRKVFSSTYARYGCMHSMVVGPDRIGLGCGPNSLHIHAVLALPWFEHFRCPPVLAYRFRRSSSACFTRLGMASSLDLGAPSNSSPKIASFVVAVHGGRIVQYAYTQKTNGQAIQAQRFTTRLVPSPCRQSARPKAPT